jgi:hypothetical protein
MSMGMKESADESDLEYFNRPKMDLQQLRTHIILSLGAL